MLPPVYLPLSSMRSFRPWSSPASPSMASWLLQQQVCLHWPQTRVLPLIQGFTVIQPPFKVPGLTPRCILRLEGNNYAICGWIIIVIVDTGMHECASDHDSSVHLILQLWSRWSSTPKDECTIHPPLTGITFSIKFIAMRLYIFCAIFVSLLRWLVYSH